jgi:hypothetical protein
MTLVSTRHKISHPAGEGDNGGRADRELRSRDRISRHTDGRGRYLVVDYDDRNQENLEDFKRMDPGFYSDADGFSDKASSWRWFAPPGLPKARARARERVRPKPPRSRAR